MPADFAHNVRVGVGGECNAALAVEAIGGFEQPDRSGLHEVSHRLAAVGITAGDFLRKAQVFYNEVVATGVDGLHCRNRSPVNFELSYAHD